ncbi:MAG TPA: DUF4388 domain-containing protein [Aggregatilineales bacterium]|nr:DUF4388 domain-containing protein [Aggregatilineales bacterium]HPV08465.1 DUF4388 domain-containing protein [Aggregatilineales bacterium]HQA69123.1 DUF4388 domain-containing protein [Aggregatilineales bacterium]HQE19230.1 DUF4388 domain-containing protein [Aggregatilineales bacterium]
MKGNLRDFSPTQLLSLISLAKKTGTLRVERSKGEAKLSFKNGKLIYAAIGDADGSLASVLARAGRITEAQASQLARHALRTGDKQLGLLLIQKGYVSQADIIHSFKRHGVASINYFAGWKEGWFEFFPDQGPDDARITVPLDLENLIIQIARIQKRDEQLEEEIPSLDVALKFSNRPNVKLSDLQLNRDEWQVLHYIKPENTIRMIARKLNMSDRQIRRAVGSLREAGLVELAHARRREKLTVEEKKQKRALVGRLIEHIQNIGAE